MKCPYCSWEESKVVDTRPIEEKSAIRRRRECLKCFKRFTTYEKVEEVPVMVIKKDGRREAFSRKKILNGLLKSCQKRPVPMKEIERLVDEVEKQVYNSAEREVTSQQSGEMIKNQLKDIDEVSYVRFASVYRQFKDINTFMDELSKLIKEK